MILIAGDGRTLRGIFSPADGPRQPPNMPEAFAAAALELKDNPSITPAQLLAPRRPQDRKADLWTTASVVQEHLLRGGDRGRAAIGRRTTIRPVRSVGEDLRLNRALWALAERMAELAS
jgi:hypothetical protein